MIPATLPPFVVVGPNADLQAVSGRRRAATAAEMIAAAVTNMARLEAALAGSEAEVRLDEVRRAAVPASLHAVLDQRLEADARNSPTPAPTPTP
ncbi:hypothetical protein [Jannaschia faecimaris]|uniref:hypothetical protein n=1 Tax=Jannaschia faecimaris TaxID=1244108 RepID=UPI001113672F|nr:hypothetical protein [Jannaschia faecimaris]